MERLIRFGTLWLVLTPLLSFAEEFQALSPSQLYETRRPTVVYREIGKNAAIHTRLSRAGIKLNVIAVSTEYVQVTSKSKATGFVPRQDVTPLSSESDWTTEPSLAGHGQDHRNPFSGNIQVGSQSTIRLDDRGHATTANKLIGLQKRWLQVGETMRAIDGTVAIRLVRIHMRRDYTPRMYFSQLSIEMPRQKTKKGDFYPGRSMEFDYQGRLYRLTAIENNVDRQQALIHLQDIGAHAYR